ncbi:hypothetical protein A4S02_10575 [Acetobacter ascendens]|uniref:Uncharacterized protein n=1 Tax=Acetobacter ascendens TaxID=481146 RepID=A0A1D8QXR6_9PROT|nr:hypothetical protein [Acetobacter ascendens]AOW47135.1 hypothetical protein A4S02_10575 [Acetobacter ascendens]
MTVEAYKIGVSLVADATQVVGPVGEMIRALERLASTQKDVQMGFNNMVSSLGGARRLTAGMASDMERAARAARTIAAASTKFRAPVAPQSGEGAGGFAPFVSPVPTGRARATSPVPPSATPITDAGGSYVSPYSAAAMNVPGAPVPLLPPPQTGTALIPLPGHGDSMGNTPNFRRVENPADYRPNWTQSEPVPGTALIPYPGNLRMDGKWVGGNQTYGPWKPISNAPSGSPAANMAERGATIAAAARLPHWVGPLAAYEGAHGVAHFAASGFDQAAGYDQTFRGMSGDPVAAQNMGAIQAIAQQSMKDNPFLAPNDAARIAQESYQLSGGEVGESPHIASLLNRVDKSFLLMGKSPEAAMKESIDFIRAQDLSNRFYDKKTGQFSFDRAEKSTNTALAMYIANKQFMNGHKFLAFAKSAGAEGMRMSDEGLLNFSHFIDVNPNRAATAIKSFDDLFLGNHTRMTKKDFAYFSQKKFGLIGRNGQFVDQQTLAEDPIGWITKHISPLLRAHPEMIGYFQRNNVQDVVNETTGAEGNIARQSAAARRTDVAKTLDALAKGPKAAQLAMDTSFERLEFTIGRITQGPFVKSINLLTQTFNGMADFAEKHPDDIRMFANDVYMLLQVVTSVGGLIGKAMDSLPGWLRRFIEAGVSGAAAGAATGATVALPFGGVPAVPAAAFGALGGGLLGAATYAINEGFLQSDGIARKVNVTPTGAWTPPVQMRTQPTTVQEGDTHVSVYLDGKQIAGHVQSVVRKDYDREMRASNAMPDPLSTPRVPGVPGW